MYKLFLLRKLLALARVVISESANLFGARTLLNRLISMELAVF